MPQIRLTTAALVALGTLLTPGMAVGWQDADGGAAPTLSAYPITEDQRLDLDGRLDDAAWLMAEPASDFTQQEPSEGGVPSQRTEIRVAFDKEAFFIGAMIYDDPDGILAFQKQRDAGLGTDDRFMWILDTFLDGRTGYFFEINAAGLMGDGIITGGGGGGGGGGPGGGGGGFGVNKSWDGIWEARVARLENGWSAEIRIPFRTLNFDPALDTWGINFQRTIRRRNEEILWRGYRRNQGLRRPIHAGRVTGLRGMSQGIGLEVLPSAVAGWRSVIEDEDPNTFPRDVSLDVNYSITPSLRASFSVNTDFAEVEVDDRRVNLTRFPQRFPERRDFFLEGSGVFSFAGSSGVSPYFSRRIGLEGGEQVPIDYGARLGGQAGRYELGFIHVGTGSHTFLDPDDAPLPSETFTVARVRRSIFTQSTIGAIYTRRATSTDIDGGAAPDRHTAGIDVDLFTSSLFGDKNAQFEAFFVWNSNPDPSLDRALGELSARGLRFDFPNDVWSGHVSYRELGSEYDPDVGFVTRNGFRRLEPRIGFRPRIASVSWLRSLDFSTQFRYLTSIETGQVEERELEVNVLGVNFETGDNIDLQVTRTYEFLDEAFEVSDGIDIASGRYSTTRYSIRGRTTGSRRFSLNGSVGLGDFWNGDRKNLELGLTVRPAPGTSLSSDWERNMVTLPQGHFTASVYRLSGEWSASPWVSVTGNLQYDDVSEVVGAFARLRWIVKPGNDVYLVYTHNAQRLHDDPLDRRFATLSRGASLKVNYTYRF